MAAKIERILKSLMNQWLGDALSVRLANGVLWSLAGSIAAQGLALLATIPVARLLGATGYGELGMIQSTLVTFVFFSGPSLGQTATKYVAELRYKDPGRVGRIIGLTFTVGLIVSALLGLALFIVAPYLASQTLNAPQLSLSLQIAALALFLNGLNGAQIGVLYGFEAFGSVAKINFWRGLVALPSMIAGAWLWGVKGVVIALVFVAFITMVITQWMLRDATQRAGVAIHYRNAMREWRILFSFYLPSVLAGVVVLPVTWGANAMLVNQPNGYVQMGIFNAANQWRMAVLFLPTIVAQPVLPILSNLYGGNELRDFSQVLRINLALAALTALIPALIVAAASRWIMQGYGAGFSQGAHVLLVLALTTVLSASIAVIGTVIASVGRRWHSTGLNFIWAVAFLVACLMLVHYGAMGLALAYLISYLIHLFTVGAYALLYLCPMIKKTASVPSVYEGLS